MKQRRGNFLKKVTSVAVAGAVMASAVPVLPAHAATEAQLQAFREEHV